MSKSANFALALVFLVLITHCGESDPNAGSGETGPDGTSATGAGAASSGSSGASSTGGAAQTGGTSGKGGTGPVLGPVTCDNVAPLAVLEAQSTAPDYLAAKVVDGFRDTGLGQDHSWTNSSITTEGAHLPQWFDFDFGEARTLGRVELYTTEEYAVSDYDILWWDGTSYRVWESVTGNTALHRTHELPLISTTRLRILGRKGSPTQPGYIRLNEVELYGGSAADCQDPGETGPLPPPPSLHPVSRTSISSEIGVEPGPCIPDDLDYSCEFLDGEAYESCSYEVLDGTREFEMPPAPEYEDTRLWPGALLSRVEPDGSAFTVWQVDRAPMDFTLSYATSHHVEAESMDPASVLAFQEAQGRQMNRRPGSGHPSAIRMDIDRIYDGEQFDLLTGLSHRIDGIEDALRFYGFGEHAPESIALVTLTFTYYTVEVDVSAPLALEALLATPPTTEPPVSPALIQRVVFGNRLVLLAHDPGEFDDFAAFLTKVVNHALAGTEQELSVEELQRFTDSESVAMTLVDYTPADVTELATVETLSGLIAMRREFGTGRRGTPIAYRITDLDGQVLKRTLKARYVEPSCSSTPP
jgi:hypothetical protein